MDRIVEKSESHAQSPTDQFNPVSTVIDKQIKKEIQEALPIAPVLA